MKKKIVILLIALLAIAAAVVAAVNGMNTDTVVVDTSDAVIVTDEGVPEAETADENNEEAAPSAEAEAEEAIEIMELYGSITEITDEFVMFDAGEMGMIQANISDDTLIEGVDELIVGQTAVIMYDGKMTRSIPAQITALHIGVYEVKGTVTDVADGRATVQKTEGGEEVVLTLPENAPDIAVGDAIIAYTTGVSTMSLPPQMNALTITK